MLNHSAQSQAETALRRVDQTTHQVTEVAHQLKECVLRTERQTPQLEAVKEDVQRLEASLRSAMDRNTKLADQVTETGREAQDRCRSLEAHVETRLAAVTQGSDNLQSSSQLQAERASQEVRALLLDVQRLQGAFDANTAQSAEFTHALAEVRRDFAELSDAVSIATTIGDKLRDDFALGSKNTLAECNEMLTRGWQQLQQAQEEQGQRLVQEVGGVTGALRAEISALVQKVALVPSLVDLQDRFQSELEELRHFVEEIERTAETGPHLANQTAVRFKDSLVQIDARMTKALLSVEATIADLNVRHTKDLGEIHRRLSAVSDARPNDDAKSQVSSLAATVADLAKQVRKLDAHAQVELRQVLLLFDLTSDEVLQALQQGPTAKAELLFSTPPFALALERVVAAATARLSLAFSTTVPQAGSPVDPAAYIIRQSPSATQNVTDFAHGPPSRALPSPNSQQKQHHNIVGHYASSVTTGTPAVFTYGRLGLEVTEHEDMRGVRVTGLADLSPAAKAGVLVGDIVVILQGLPIGNNADFAQAVQLLKLQESVTATVRRMDGSCVDLRLRLPPLTK
eukprot:TRINITY_DN19124_c0_g1_i1.p2 TRINITY_DN19124_c0_g1~~TRINITY_DN19124_c0_g1_i1.p2  ORF type:complete len:571 (+),score=118.79 TRINITY_DN19124_c0_g1_i1:662-2374(+)